MASQAKPTKRRLQIVVRESACPGLIGNLAQLPEGDENVFIRAVLTEWFLANGNSVQSAGRLVDQYRVIEFRNANGIRSDDYASVGLSNPTTALPHDRGIERSMQVVRSVPNAESRDDPTTKRSLPSESHMPPAPLAEQTAAPVPSKLPAFEADFDPDMF